MSIDFAPTTQDLQFYAGDTVSMTVFVYDTTDQPYDLTGCTARADIHQKPKKDVVLASFVCTIIGNGISMSLAEGVTQGLPFSSVYDLELILPTSEVISLLRGKITTRTDVTR